MVTGKGGPQLSLRLTTKLQVGGRVPAPWKYELAFASREAGFVICVDVAEGGSGSSENRDLIERLDASSSTGDERCYPLNRRAEPGANGCVRSVVDVIKHLTVSTAHLKVFLLLQLRPINLVVYQGSLGLAAMQILSRGGLPA